jgi:hypothetical protein
MVIASNAQPIANLIADLKYVDALEEQYMTKRATPARLPVE